MERWTIRVCGKHGALRQSYCPECGSLGYDFDSVEVVPAAEYEKLRALCDEAQPFLGAFGMSTENEARWRRRFARAALSEQEGSPKPQESAESCGFGDRLKGADLSRGDTE